MKKFSLYHGIGPVCIALMTALLVGCVSMNPERRGEAVVNALGELEEGNRFINKGQSYEVTFPKQCYFTPCKMQQSDIRLEKQYFPGKLIKYGDWPHIYYRIGQDSTCIYYFFVLHKSAVNGSKAIFQSILYMGYAPVTTNDLLQPILQYLENTVTPQQVMYEKRGPLDVYYASIMVADPKGKRYEHAMVVYNKMAVHSVITLMVYSGFGDKARIDGENIYKSIRPIKQ